MKFSADYHHRCYEFGRWSREVVWWIVNSLMRITSLISRTEFVKALIHFKVISSKSQHLRHTSPLWAAKKSTYIHTISTFLFLLSSLCFLGWSTWTLFQQTRPDSGLKISNGKWHALGLFQQRFFERAPRPSC